jgi:hypothetical protein
MNHFVKETMPVTPGQPPVTPGQPPANESGVEKKVLRKWKAKVDCIYQEKYTRAGEVVQVENMENPNFEPLQE